jgi:hypothetical protein
LDDESKTATTLSGCQSRLEGLSGSLAGAEGFVQANLMLLALGRPGSS